MENFKLSAISKWGSTKFAEIRFDDGYVLTYVPIPSNVRYALKSIDRFLRTDEGMALIKEMMG